jgi:hypothetical protein
VGARGGVVVQALGYKPGSIPESVIGNFNLLNLSGRTMALGLTQPLTETSTRCISWDKGGRCVGLTTLPPSCADVWNLGS